MQLEGAPSERGRILLKRHLRAWPLTRSGPSGIRSVVTVRTRFEPVQSGGFRVAVTSDMLSLQVPSSPTYVHVSVPVMLFLSSETVNW